MEDKMNLLISVVPEFVVSVSFMVIVAVKYRVIYQLNFLIFSLLIPFSELLLC